MKTAIPKKPTAKMSPAEKLAALQEKLKNIDYGGSAGFWSPKADTKSTIRVLPGVGDMEWFYQQVGTHNLPPNGEKRFYCPKFTSEGKLPCPICEVVDQLYHANDKASKDLASQLKVRKGFWMNVIVRGDEKSGPKIYTPGTTVMERLTSMITNPDIGDVTDPDDGFDLLLERKGSGMKDTKYTLDARRNPSPLSADADEANEWLEAAKDLSYVEVSEDPDEDQELAAGHAVFVLPYDRLDAEFNGEELEVEAEEEEGDEDDDEEEEKPRKPAARTTRPSRR